ncbi:MAG: hypothetical protein M5U29_09990 [Anaerolineae bacterium]|nr:hypothetical protein [Anaerolineae bacterium]
MLARLHLGGALAAVVRDACGAHIGNAPAGSFGAATPVQFLGEHDVAFVQPADLLVDFAAGDQRAALHPVHLEGAIVGQVGCVEMVEQAARRISLQPGALEEGGQRGGEAAARGLGGAVGVEHARPGDTHLGVRVQVGCQRGQRVVVDDRVGVQQQQMTPARASQGQVVAAREADVLALGEQMHPGESLRDQRGRAVRAGRVHDDDLDTRPAIVERVAGGGDARHRAGGDALQAGGEQVAHVPRDDEDGEVYGGGRVLGQGSVSSGIGSMLSRARAGP